MTDTVLTCITLPFSTAPLPAGSHRLRAEAGGHAGLARYILRVRGKTITNSQEIFNADDILVGRTALKFVARRLSS